VIEEFDRLRWHRSRYCGSGACLEYAPAGNVVYIRDSKQTAGPTLAMPAAAWGRFLESVGRGRIARPTG
jgi:Domain of unknown function (DUF397)